MSQLPSKWMCGNCTPWQAALKVLNELESDILLAGGNYKVVRTEVRYRLSELLPEFGIANRRYFISAVIHEMCVISGFRLVSEAYAIEDVAEYNNAIRRQAASIAGPYTKQVPEGSVETPEGYVSLPETTVTLDPLNTTTVAWARQQGKTFIYNKEKQMALNNTKLIETRTFINGVDASTLSDDQIFQVIAKVENDIKELENIENKPTKLIKKIEKAHKGIEKVLRYVDAR